MNYDDLIYNYWLEFIYYNNNNDQDTFYKNNYKKVEKDFNIKLSIIKVNNVFVTNIIYNDKWYHNRISYKNKNIALMAIIYFFKKLLNL